MTTPGSPQTALDDLRLMLTIRRFEEKVLSISDHIAGHYHVCTGMESTALALRHELQSPDKVITNYRSHGHLIAAGSPLNVLFAEILGKDLGPQRGRAGSFHLEDPDHGVLHTSAMVSGGVPIATGVALALKRQGDGVCICFFGDGAVNEGGVHESFNWAALWQLPVIYVCENNGVAGFGKANSFQASESIAAIAETNTIRTEIADGRHPYDVVEKFRILTKEARNSGGPTFLEARFAPWPGNQTFLPKDVTGPTDLFGEIRESPHREWYEEGDPVLALVRQMIGDGWRRDQIEEVDGAVKSEVESAAAGALAAPSAPPATAMDHVYGET